MLEQEIQEMETTAKTVEEAIEVGLHELDAARDEVEVEVLNPGKPGFLGIRSELARVRIRKLSANEDVSSKSMETVSKILEMMNVSAVATLSSAFDSEAGGPLIDIEGEDSGLLIGRRGETLRAYQFIVNIIVNNNRQGPVRVTLDVEQYRSRRQASLEEMARRTSERVIASGRPVYLEPMTPADRRIVHMALADNPRVTTESNGRGSGRGVVISPV
ncbi:protein jag [SAR202 cluster bacterium AD-804-J14_MRT_500m]|nr:protein jag [SAR202 cluster bacterium AD-804-J14_MRT_500m]